MSGPRASGSQTCKPSFALLRHEVAPRADKSIRVHERHDNRQGEALRTRFRWQRGQDRIRDHWVMSQPVAISSRFRLKRAGHNQSPIPAIAPHLTPSRQLRRVSLTNPFTTRRAASAAGPGETSVPAVLAAYTVALCRAGRYREADELLGQASIRGAFPNARNSRSSAPSANAPLATDGDWFNPSISH